MNSPTPQDRRSASGNSVKEIVERFNALQSNQSNDSIRSTKPEIIKAVTHRPSKPIKNRHTLRHRANCLCHLVGHNGSSAARIHPRPLRPEYNQQLGPPQQQENPMGGLSRFAEALPAHNNPKRDIRAPGYLESPGHLVLPADSGPQHAYGTVLSPISERRRASYIAGLCPPQYHHNHIRLPPPASSLSTNNGRSLGQESILTSQDLLQLQRTTPSPMKSYVSASSIPLADRHLYKNSSLITPGSGTIQSNLSTTLPLGNTPSPSMNLIPLADRHLFKDTTTPDLAPTSATAVSGYLNVSVQDTCDFQSQSSLPVHISPTRTSAGIPLADRYLFNMQSPKMIPAPLTCEALRILQADIWEEDQRDPTRTFRPHPALETISASIAATKPSVFLEELYDPEEVAFGEDWKNPLMSTARFLRLSEGAAAGVGFFSKASTTAMTRTDYRCESPQRPKPTPVGQQWGAGSAGFLPARLELLKLLSRNTSADNAQLFAVYQYKLDEQRILNSEIRVLVEELRGSGEWSLAAEGEVLEQELETYRRIKGEGVVLDVELAKARRRKEVLLEKLGLGASEDSSDLCLNRETGEGEGRGFSLGSDGSLDG